MLYGRHMNCTAQGLILFIKEAMSIEIHLYRTFVNFYNTYLGFCYSAIEFSWLYSHFFAKKLMTQTSYEKKPIEIFATPRNSKP